MKQQKGFTLIELIIVIVILGILAVTAAPRFFDFSKDARASTIGGLKAAIQGASQTIYAKAAIDGKLAGTTATPISVEGVNTVNGYPTADEDGIIKAAQIDTTPTTGEWVFHPVTGTGIYIGLQSRPETDADIITGACYVLYKESAAANEAPVISSVVSGC